MGISLQQRRFILNNHRSIPNKGGSAGDILFFIRIFYFFLLILFQKGKKKKKKTPNLENVSNALPPTFDWGYSLKHHRSSSYY